jgi:DNA-binding GntR family transcriptional regulator
MPQVVEIADRRTNADVVFDYLYDEIVSLRMMPGTKISEVEIASRFDVSRQPVRDAFSRLANLDLVQVRPQRATEVKRFSSKSIQTARFVRSAVEMEVIRLAVRTWDGAMAVDLEKNLGLQVKAVRASDTDAFHRLDYEFHRMLCHAARADFAFDVIAQNKAMVDRLCVLSLMHPDRMAPLLDDHRRLFDLIVAGDETGAVEVGRMHLTRLDTTVSAIRRDNAEYFED